MARVYEFTDLETGKVFVGTRLEYAEHEGLKISTMDSKVKAGSIQRVDTGERKAPEKASDDVKMPKGYWLKRAWMLGV